MQYSHIKNASAAGTTEAFKKVGFFPKSTMVKTPSGVILHRCVRRVAHQSATVACVSRTSHREDTRQITTFPLVQLLNARRRYHDALLNGAPEIDGTFYGDGIPRTAGGLEYEPLEGRRTK